MVLLDHFHSPLSNELHWESFHANWATKLADALNEHWLPGNYIAEEFVHIGPHVEIDVASFARPSSSPENDGTATATAPSRVWTLTTPSMVLPSVVPDTFEVRVFCTDTGPRLVGAIELISPGNKDRAEERRAFATKCASYLYQGISLIIVDIVTNRRANLHNEIIRVMELDATFHLPANVELYGVAYRPLRREDKDQIEVWATPLALGERLPVLPLALNVELIIPVDFGATYVEVCRRKRLL